MGIEEERVETTEMTIEDDTIPQDSLVEREEKCCCN